MRPTASNSMLLNQAKIRRILAQSPRKEIE